MSGDNPRPAKIMKALSQCIALDDQTLSLLILQDLHLSVQRPNMWFHSISDLLFIQGKQTVPVRKLLQLHHWSLISVYRSMCVCWYLAIQTFCRHILKRFRAHACYSLLLSSVLIHYFLALNICKQCCNRGCSELSVRRMYERCSGRGFESYSQPITSLSPTFLSNSSAVLS